ncbi:putative GntR family transcriptional regulator [Kineosphaera limosa NBRC 100340]|uniref:Putative GntR family transcriptional regulator n=1 Tax=Kineosphaera limosa NBRC 100340 TaxID=1184609 RepID=K6WAM6_9MICO|nr:putative GntR family transcriptional regulator [Kineosphaera limosa NBRC 100340]
MRDRAFLLLRTAIVDGVLEPGEQLREQELQRWLGVSRTPIREALLRLQAAGLVEMSPGRSTVVTELESAATRDARPVVAAVHQIAVREALPHLTPSHIRSLRDRNARFAAALEAGDVDAALDADHALHALFVDVAGNSVVAAVLDQFSPLLRRLARARFASHDAANSVAEHDALIAACAAGDADEAAAVTARIWTHLTPPLDPGTRRPA